jgi:hypothetical protein
MQFIKTFLACFSLAVFVLLGPVTASAASACKGIEKDACAAKDECLWVDGYMRKDGRSVSAHCKTRSGGRSAGQADPGTVKLGHAK